MVYVYGGEGGMPSEKNVICVRLDPEDSYRLEKLAESMGLDRSKLLRQIIVQYLDSHKTGSSENQAPQVLEVVDKTTKQLEGMVNQLIKHCSDFANEVVSLHPNESQDYWYKDCIKRRRGFLREKMIEAIRKADLELSKLIPDHGKRAEYLKKMHQAMEMYLSRLQ
jgi:metal-responsive CopG/Arc/MetJ family transcriptional regulator